VVADLCHHAESWFERSFGRIESWRGTFGEGMGAGRWSLVRKLKLAAWPAGAGHGGSARTNKGKLTGGEENESFKG